jgi:hypothetical protein
MNVTAADRTPRANRNPMTLQESRQLARDIQNSRAGLLSTHQPTPASQAQNRNPILTISVPINVDFSHA